LEYLDVLSEVHLPDAVPILLRAFQSAPSDDRLQRALLQALQTYDEPEIANVLLKQYPTLGRDCRTTAQALLSSRPNWALSLAREIETPTLPNGARIQAASLSLSTVRKLKQLPGTELQQRLARIWPDTGSPTTAEMDQKIQRLAALIRSGEGSPYSGRTLFQNTCGTCHKLFGQGAEIGPELTVYNRADVESMLLAIVNPNAEIREGYENYMLLTKDDRSLSGFLVEQDERTIVLRGLDNQNISLARTEVAELKPAGVSLMPEGLLDALDEQQTRDLFAYLRSTQPLVGEPPKRPAHP
jgi:putative heme-binding domain-containing protein